MKPVATDITVLKQLTAIRLDISIWSARKKLTPSDFGTSNLPPESIASLGSKKVCNPEDLRIFGMLKARAMALLDRQGMRFLGGWVIPETAINDVIAALDGIAADFESAKTTFLARYDAAVQDWISQNLGWESLIAGSQVNVDTVRARLGFAWQMYKITPPRKVDAARPLHDAVTGLGQSLFGEGAKIADEAWSKSFAGKLEVSLKALSPIKSLRQKLAGLSFVEPRVAPVVDLIDAALASIPDKGPISGGDLVMMQGLVCLLRDPQALVEHGQKIIDGQAPNHILQGLVALPPQSPRPVIEDEDGEDEDESSTNDLVHDPMPGIESLGLW